MVIYNMVINSTNNNNKCYHRFYSKHLEHNVFWFRQVKNFFCFCKKINFGCSLPVKKLGEVFYEVIKKKQVYIRGIWFMYFFTFGKNKQLRYKVRQLCFMRQCNMFNGTLNLITYSTRLYIFMEQITFRILFAH